MQDSEGPRMLQFVPQTFFLSSPTFLPTSGLIGGRGIWARDHLVQSLSGVQLCETSIRILVSVH